MEWRNEWSAANSCIKTDKSHVYQQHNNTLSNINIKTIAASDDNLRYKGGNNSELHLEVLIDGD